MCDFSRVSAWFCDEKISLKKSCFYLYIRRNDVSNRATSAACKRYNPINLINATSTPIFITAAQNEVLAISVDFFNATYGLQ